MDADRFDVLARALSSLGTRRALLRLGGSVPLAGGLLTRLEAVVEGQGNGAIVGGGGGRRRRRRARHRDHHDRDKEEDKDRDKKRRHRKRLDEGPCPRGQTVCADGVCRPCCPDCTGSVCGSDGCDGSCGSCPCGSRCCAGGCCPAAPSGRTQLCYQDACCEPQCDAAGVTCGAGNEAAKCGFTSCGTCATGVCVQGGCSAVCTTTPCPPGCANCLVSPSGARICAASTASSCTGTCRSDADCCPGETCAASPATCTGRMVCYVLTSDPACPT